MFFCVGFRGEHSLLMLGISESTSYFKLVATKWSLVWDGVLIVLCQFVIRYESSWSIWINLLTAFNRLLDITFSISYSLLLSSISSSWWSWLITLDPDLLDGELDFDVLSSFIIMLTLILNKNYSKLLSYRILFSKFSFIELTVTFKNNNYALVRM